MAKATESFLRSFRGGMDLRTRKKEGIFGRNRWNPSLGRYRRKESFFRRRCTSASASGNGEGSLGSMENTNGTHEDVASSLSEETRSFQEGSTDAVRRGFRSVVLAGCEFLVGITPEGMMDLREVYVHDSTTGIYGKPEYVGDPPSGPAHYFEAPWEHVQPGDPVTYKERKVELLKLYLIEEKNKHPLELNLKEVFCLDGKRQQVQHLAVKGSEAANPRDTRLVIREGEIFLGNIRELPTPTQIFNDMKRAEEEGRRPIHHQQGIQSDEEDEELDFEEYDVPEVDML